MKKVLFILPTLNAGGAENYVLRFIRFCGTVEYDWHVLSPNLTKGDLHCDFEAAGCKVYYQSIGYFNPIKALRLFNLMNRQSFQIIANFNGNFGGLSLMVAYFAGVPKRIAWHRRSTDAFGTNSFKKIYNRLANQLIRWNATHILSNSRFALNNFYGTYQHKDSRFFVVANGLDAKLFDISETKVEVRRIIGLPTDIFIIGHVGRYDPAKNHETIFKVIQGLKKLGIVFKFLFCGKNTDSIVFQERIRFYSIEDHVISLGLRRDLHMVYRSLDLFYFPSLTEGQPNALIEAMLSGLSILASNIPSIREALPECAHHQLLPPLDSRTAVSYIENFQKTQIADNECSLKNWATKYFNYEKNFNKFCKILDE